MGKHVTLRMHRIITNAPQDKQVDHINGNPLDNRKCNLRVCTQKENSRNREKRKEKTSSIYKGVCFHKRKHKWQASITLDGKLIHLGYFKTQNEAALIYNEAAKKYHGEFAKFNKVSS